jgi:hypothetical protein
MAHTNVIDSTWRHLTAFLNPYNPIGDYNYQLAHYVLARGCRSDNVDQFTKFIGISATTAM